MPDRAARLGVKAAGAVLALVEQHARLHRRAGQQLVAIRPERRLEQRSRDAPTEGALQLVAARVEDGDALLARHARAR